MQPVLSRMQTAHSNPQFNFNSLSTLLNLVNPLRNSVEWDPVIGGFGTAAIWHTETSTVTHRNYLLRIYRFLHLWGSGTYRLAPCPMSNAPRLPFPHFVVS